MAAGNSHTCAIAVDGRVHCWGREDEGQVDAPEGQFELVVAGTAKSCALNANRQPTCWGNDVLYNYEHNPRFTALSADEAVCGVVKTGGILCWGRTSGRYFDLSPVTNDQTEFQAIAVGAKHICAIRLDGTLDCWGDNLYAQMAVPEGQFSDIAAGELHSCGVRKDGSLVCWGANTFRQSEPPPVGTVAPSRATFPFANLANHWYGHAIVQRRGKTITATIAAARLPVQHAGRQAPAPLLVLPVAWRPAIDIEWKVSGDPVLQDGSPDSLQQQIQNFTLRIGTDGAVTVADNEQLDGVGYVHFRTRLAWPRQGTEPDVCHRSADAQTAILAALQYRHPEVSACGDVTWHHLAGIEEFGLPDRDGGRPRRASVNQPDDLAGMHGLRSANLFLDYLLPVELLAPAPDLRTLRVSGGNLHGDYFFYSLHLPVLPTDLLDHVPRLTTLILTTYTLAELPDTFLAAVPELEKLIMWWTFPSDPPGSWWSFSSLPTDLFSFTPKLQSVKLWLLEQHTMPADPFALVPRLADLLHLREFVLTLSNQMDDILNCFLDDQGTVECKDPRQSQSGNG